MPRLLAITFTLAGCGTSQDAPTVELPVTTAAAALPATTTDLGYVVELTSVRVAVTAIQFTIRGETHEVAARATGPLPHPGHSAGGEVTGELVGDHVLAWGDGSGAELGLATLIVGKYEGANFAIRAATADDDLPADDPLLGHAFHLTGTITRDEVSRPFDAVLDVERDTVVIGAVFDTTITTATTATLAIAFTPDDPYDDDTVFDGVDFFALPGESPTIAIRPGETAHNIIRRVIQTHDHYAVILE
jgi:hypothetical protein